MSTYDPLDLAPQEDAEQRVRLERLSEESDFKWLMGSKRGRRIVWRQLERSGVFRLSFNTNAMAMAFAEGNRNDGLRTLSLIQSLCPELHSVMLKERSNERNTDDDRR